MTFVKNSQELLILRFFLVSTYNSELYSIKSYSYDDTGVVDNNNCSSDVHLSWRQVYNGFIDYRIYLYTVITIGDLAIVESDSYSQIETLNTKEWTWISFDFYFDYLCVWFCSTSSLFDREQNDIVCECIYMVSTGCRGSLRMLVDISSRRCANIPSRSYYLCWSHKCFIDHHFNSSIFFEKRK